MQSYFPILIALILLITFPAQQAAAQSGRSECSQAPNLIAHWMFDELVEGRFADASQSGMAARAQTVITMRSGVFGAALWLERKSVVRVATGDVFESLPAITICSWVKPNDLSGYRDIFRKEDGARRILFSFQTDGRILSLGLQTEGTGYQELDVPVDPAAYATPKPMTKHFSRVIWKEHVGRMRADEADNQPLHGFLQLIA